MQFRKSIFLLSVFSCIFLCSSAFSEYIDNGDGTVTDTATGLMWQKATAPGGANLKQASNYCDNISLGGYSDWRVPTVKELSILFAISTPAPVTIINTNSFPDTKPFNYMTSTRITAATWPVRFYSGSGLHSTKEREAADTVVKCVRGND
jgi:hypothetical protein